MSLTWLPLNPLARCAGETRRASAALSDYAAMGAGRSLRDLCALYCQRIVDEGSTKSVPTTRMPTLARWSVDNDWQARVDVYDAQQQAAARAVQEAARNRAIEKAIEDQLEDARIMRAKAREIVSTLPLVKQVGSDPKTGEPLVIAPASSAEYRAARAMLDSAAKLEAARLGLPTEVQQVDVTTGGQPLDTAFEAALRRVYGGEHEPGNVDAGPAASRS